MSGAVHITIARSSGSVADVWIWVVVLLVVVVLGGVLIIMVRKRAHGDDLDRPALGLSLADLREMKAEGRLSDEEFERAKAMVIGELGGKVERTSAERVRVQGRIVDGALRARPGYDLTGQPLPGSEDGSSPPEEVGGDEAAPDGDGDDAPPRA